MSPSFAFQRTNAPRRRLEPGSPRSCGGIMAGEPELRYVNVGVFPSPPSDCPKSVSIKYGQTNASLDGHSLRRASVSSTNSAHSRSTSISTTSSRREVVPVRKSSLVVTPVSPAHRTWRRKKPQTAGSSDEEWEPSQETHSSNDGHYSPSSTSAKAIVPNGMVGSSVRRGSTATTRTTSSEGAHHEGVRKSVAFDVSAPPLKPEDSTPIILTHAHLYVETAVLTDLARSKLQEFVEPQKLTTSGKVRSSDPRYDAYARRAHEAAMTTLTKRINEAMDEYRRSVITS